MSEVVLVFVLNTFITVLIATILNKRIDDTNKRFERRMEELKQEIEKLRANKLFDWRDELF